MGGQLCYSKSMARRRDIRPPFEVMKAAAHSASAGSQEGSPTLSVAPPVADSESGRGSVGMGHRHAGGSGAESWARLRQPLVLRLPPGYAVLIVLGVLILLIVAYSAGYSQGGSSMTAKYDAQSRNEQNIASRMTRGGTSVAGNSSTNSGAPRQPGANGTTAGGNAGRNGTSGNNQAVVGGVTSTATVVRGVYDDTSMDPRKPNYQYYIVAHCSKDEAERLVGFFGDRGVEAAAVISHNRRSQYVVFVLRPFTREQTASNEARELKLKIFEWGKVWASREFRGPTNLSDAYMAVYHPKEN